MSVDQEVSSDKEFVVLSVLCKEETQEGSSSHRAVSEACVMPHTKTWFVGTNYSLVFVMDMSASMAAVVRVCVWGGGGGGTHVETVVKCLQNTFLRLCGFWLRFWWGRQSHVYPRFLPV